MKELVMLIDRINNRRGAEIAWEKGCASMSIKDMKDLLAYIREKIGRFSVGETENFNTAINLARLYNSKVFARSSLRFVLELPDNERDNALDSIERLLH